MQSTLKNGSILYTEPKRNIVDITNEFFEKATPNIGRIKYDKDIDMNGNEARTAQILFKNFGGNINVLKENSKAMGIKQPDYYWNHKYWDEKTVKENSSLGAIDNRIKSGLSQIAYKTGGIILNIENKKLTDEAIITKTMNRMKFSPLDYKVIVIRDGEVLKVLGKKSQLPA